jgi:DNA-binding GntR family transcriptional regulator
MSRLRRFDLQEMRDLYETRAVLDCLAVAFAAERMTRRIVT